MTTITSAIIMDMHKNQNFIVSVHTSARWVKPAQPSEPIFLTPMLLIGGH